MPSSNEEVGIILSELSEMFKEELSQGRINGYIEVLKHYSYENLQYAVKEITRTRMSHWFPLPAEITNIIHTDRQPAYKALPEPEPTQEEFTYGQWQCRFAIWLMGVEKRGTRREALVPGVYGEKSIFKQIGPNRWKEAQTQVGRQKLWNEFCQERKVPERVATVPIN